MLNKKLKLSINPKLINKNQSDDKTLFVEGWKNVELTPQDLAESINDGKAYCAQLSGPRKGANFLCSDVVSVDIDGTRRIEETLCDPLVAKYATILYTTPNHTEESHRFRLIFALPRTINSAGDMTAAARSLALRLSGDPAAVDPTRLYYGSTGSNPQVFDRRLDEQTLDELIRQGQRTAQPDTIDGARGNASFRSILTLKGDAEIRTRDGSVTQLKDIPPRTSVCCPFHNDIHASAFTLSGRTGTPGIHCSVCQGTFWTAEESTSKIDFFDFDKAIHKTFEMSEKKDFDSPIRLPSFFNQLLARPRIRILNEKYFSGSELLPGITFIKSPKGSGKTSALPDILRESKGTIRHFVFPDNSEGNIPEVGTHETRSFDVLLIGHRQALIRDMCQRLDLNCYLDDGKYGTAEIIRRQNNYGICLDSLPKIRRRQNPYDLVIIDESEQVLGHFLSDTLEKSREKIFLYLERFLGEAKHVIALDADLGWTSFETITRLGGATRATVKESKPVWILFNDYDAPRGVIQSFRSEDHLMADLHIAIEGGQRVFVTSNSKAKIDAIDATLSETFGSKIKKIKITAENSGKAEIQEFILNVKTKSLEYQAILTSPSLGTGVDITFEEGAQHIDVVYGFFESLVNTHFDVDQQIGRVRNPKEINVWVSPRQFSFETDIEVVRHDLLVNNLVANTLIGFDASGEEMYERDEPLLDMASLIVSNQRASKNLLRKNFIDLKQSQGWKVADIAADDELSRTGRGMFEVGKKRRDDEFAASVINATPIDQGKYIAIEEKFDLNVSVPEMDRWSFMQGAIEAFYRQKISKPLIDFDRKGLYRSCVRYFESITDAELMEERNATAKMKHKEPNKRKLKLIADDSLKSLLLYQILNCSPLFSDGNFSLDSEISSDDLKEFSRFVKKLKPYIETILDVEVREDILTKPIQQLGKFLSLAGLGLKRKRTQKTGDRKVYFYQIDSDLYDQMTRTCDLRKTDEDLPWRYVHRIHGFGTTLYKRVKEFVPTVNGGYDHWVMIPEGTTSQMPADW